jgi:hypothetical protein
VGRLALAFGVGYVFAIQLNGDRTTGRKFGYTFINFVGLTIAFIVVGIILALWR